jgi:hypothetical protein
MAQRSTLIAVAGCVALFVAIVATIIVLLALGVVTFAFALLLLIALLGLYLGFGVLIAVHRFVSRLR